MALPGDTTSPEMRELADGVAFWRSRPPWPADFHNADYERWSRENPHGNFTLDWWQPFLKTLQAWIATRPVSGAVLTSRFTDCATDLSEAWHVACEPCLQDDVSTVTWDQVEAFPRVVATIKPTQIPSPVFTSKFCHFLLPRVFPVVDNEGLGNKWSTYETYFRLVQNEWSATDPAGREDLVGAITDLIEAAGAQVFSGFPMTNKIVELRLMGRHHPGMSAAGTRHAR